MLACNLILSKLNYKLCVNKNKQFEVAFMGEKESHYEHVLRSAIADSADNRCPPTLAAALDYAVFPGGARVRPKLCLAVAMANHCDAPVLAAPTAASSAHRASPLPPLPHSRPAGRGHYGQKTSRLFPTGFAVVSGRAKTYSTR